MYHAGGQEWEDWNEAMKETLLPTQKLTGSQAKKVVWKYSDGKKVGVHHFQILDTNGHKLSGPAMK